MQLRREAHFGVDDPIGGQILGAFAGDAYQRSSVCMTATVWLKASRYRSSEPEARAAPANHCVNRVDIRGGEA